MGIVKILDFGIAKILADGEELAGLDEGTETDLGVLVGTPGLHAAGAGARRAPVHRLGPRALAVVALRAPHRRRAFPVTNSEVW